MKIRKYKVIFVYILQGKMGKTEKNGKKITQLKWPNTKNQKPKYKNMGWTHQDCLYYLLEKSQLYDGLGIEIFVKMIMSKLTMQSN